MKRSSAVNNNNNNNNEKRFSSSFVRQATTRETNDEEEKEEEKETEGKKKTFEEFLHFLRDESDGIERKFETVASATIAREENRPGEDWRLRWTNKTGKIH